MARRVMETKMTDSVKFNDAGDILYVRLREGKVATTKAFGDDRLVDLDEKRAVLGVEFIGIEREIDIRGLPDYHRLHETLISGGPPNLIIQTDLTASSGSVAFGRGGVSCLPSRITTNGRTIPQDTGERLPRTSGPVPINVSR